MVGYLGPAKRRKFQGRTGWDPHGTTDGLRVDLISVLHQAKAKIPRCLIIRIPISSLLRNLGTSSRFTHDYAVYTEDRACSFGRQTESPRLRSEGVVDFVLVGL